MSDYYDNVKRAFKETLAHVGVPLLFNGRTKLCVTAPIERKLAAQVSGYLPEVLTAIDIVDDDFKELQRFGLQDRSTVVVDKTQLRVVGIDSEPSDPIVHLMLTARI